MVTFVNMSTVSSTPTLEMSRTSDFSSTSITSDTESTSDLMSVSMSIPTTVATTKENVESTSLNFTKTSTFFSGSTTNHENSGNASEFFTLTISTPELTKPQLLNSPLKKFVLFLVILIAAVSFIGIVALALLVLLIKNPKRNHSKKPKNAYNNQAFIGVWD